MAEEAQTTQDTRREEPLVLDKLKTGSVITEIFYGFGIMLGLALLWALEVVRDAFFRLLDKMNIKPRPHRASAFPPGPSREHTTVEARR
ncbi:MAG TPA: hypothetical protein VJ718_02300 [Candidatus Binataceae bacterium]|nr:hypothetical protein [Candidatus Binataceae bacterium]